MKHETISKILEQLKEKQLIHEKEGVFEIKHDTVALVVNNRRTTEDKNIMAATQLIYETEKNGGNLNELQLARIEPYRDRLPFKDEDKQRLHKWLANERHLIEKKAKKDRVLRQRAIVAAFFSACLAVVASFFYFYSEKQTVLLNIHMAKNYILNENFRSAKEPIKRISIDYIPKTFIGDSIKAVVDSLKELLIFDLTASKLKVNNTYVVFSDDRVISALHTKDLGVGSWSPIFNKILSGDFASKSYKVLGHGFSKNTDAFWAVEASPIGTVLKLFKINSQTRLIPPSVIDTGEIFDADFDDFGNLYYVKHNQVSPPSVWSVSKDKRPKKLFQISRPFKKIEKLSLKFSEQADKNPSRYLKISFIERDSNYDITGNDGIYPPYIYDIVTKNLHSSKSKWSSEKKNFLTSINPVKSGKKADKKLYSLDKKSTIELINPVVIKVSTEGFKEELKLSKDQQFVTFKPFNNLFVYIYIDKYDKQHVCFKKYHSKKQRSYVIPDGWQFSKFLHDEFITFKPFKSGGSDVEKTALLHIDKKMFEKTQLTRLLASLKSMF